jgi:hypothetical protein
MSTNSRQLIDHLASGKTNEFKRGVNAAIHSFAKEAVNLKRIEIGQTLFDKAPREDTED